jgi:hypothetical protein
MDQLTDRTLGPYELRELLGKGGFGVVYRARHRRLDRERAVKVLAPLLAHDPDLRRRFEREAHLAAGLDHPNIVPIYDFDEESGLLYLAMQRDLGYKRGIAFTLRVLGHLAHHEGASARAARLMGAAIALREALGIIVVPNDRAEYDRIVESARARLGEATFASAWAEGRAMSLEQAIALALEGPPDA